MIICLDYLIFLDPNLVEPYSGFIDANAEVRV